MYILAALRVVEDILHTDPNVLFELLAVTDSVIPNGVDASDVVLGDFQRYKFIDVLAVAVEAGLL